MWPALLDLLRLDEIDTDLYRASTPFDDPFNLFGGQVAAQGLRAAASTVSSAHRVHSLHGYFLSPGTAREPVVYMVERDRDGRSYSSRRVVARQHGKVIFNLAASFHLPEDGPDLQAVTMPSTPGPHGLTSLRSRLVDIELRDPDTSDADAPWPSRVWARAKVDLGDDPHLHACVLTYVSDMYTGLFTLARHSQIDADSVSWTSLDHALWFYRPVRMDDWILMDLVGESIASGRGMYSGRIYTADGTLVAGLSQESLFRPLSAKDRNRRSLAISKGFS